MKSKYRNIFIIFGLAAIVIMLLSFDMDYAELWGNIRKAGYWFFAVVGVWVFIYLLNTASWYTLIKHGGPDTPVSFWRVYKLSISGFALNYATPGGLMGGEPYRIMELAPLLGVQRATSSVVLYVMMHIFTHVCFWLSSVLLYIAVYTVSVEMGFLLALISAFCLLAIYFFLKGYRSGMVVKTFSLLQRLPWIKDWARNFYARKREDLEKIDSQISVLHGQGTRTFIKSFCFEFGARFLTCAEIYFILKILTPHVNFVDCILIMAFTSLFSNIFFFSPMQLGAREGGFALAVSGLSLSGAFGVYASLITRVRELIWIMIGVALMKVGNLKNPSKSDAAQTNADTLGALPDQAEARHELAQTGSTLVATKAGLEKTDGEICIRGLLLDYGGTIDSGGRHWANVIWEGYQAAKVPVSEKDFREAYVYAERYLAAHPVVLLEDDFHTLLDKKVRIELRHLEETKGGAWVDKAEEVAAYCYQYARKETRKVSKVLEQLCKKYHMVMVTNFYGNMHAVLRDFGLDRYFEHIVESAVVGVRKPDPAIWKMGVEALGLPAGEVCAVGDSFDKDIESSHSAGCHTIWLKGEEWKPKQHDEKLPDAIITDIEQLPSALLGLTGERTDSR